MAHVGDREVRDDLRWTVVVPVKRLDRAKTRLSTRTSDERVALALAFARDVVAAARACPLVTQVIAVTDDRRAARTLADDGAHVVPDRPDAGLNPALAYGASLADPATGVAAVSADLPALTPGQLALALSAAGAAGVRCFVSDVAGTGTTLLCAPPGVALEPRFGARSRAAHAAGGARELALRGISGLRRDVDTEVDLWDAARLGVGTATATVLAAAATAAEPARDRDGGR